MTPLTIKQLRYFDALQRHRNFGRAADASAISQPALSVQIKDLEQSLGMPLFERGPRDVRLTGFGEEIAPRIRDILRAVSELEDMGQAAHSQAVGRLRLGIIPTVAPYILPRVIKTLSETFDGIDINVRETMTQNLIQELSEGRLDAAIVALPVSEPTLTETKLFDEDFVLVRPAADANAPVPDPSNLRQMRLLLLEEGHCFRDQALAFCQSQSAAPWQGLDASSLSTLVQMVSAGIGMTVLPEMAVDVEARAADVDIARFPAPAPRRKIGMVWRKTTPMADQMNAIAHALRQTLGA